MVLSVAASIMTHGLIHAAMVVTVRSKNMYYKANDQTLHNNHNTQTFGDCFTLKDIPTLYYLLTVYIVPQVKVVPVSPRTLKV